MSGLDMWGVFYAPDGEPGTEVVAAFVLEEDAHEWVAGNPGFAKAVYPVRASVGVVTP
jgi:uncharacterized protein YciI